MNSSDTHEVGKDPNIAIRHEVESTMLNIRVETDFLPYKIIQLGGKSEYKGSIDAHLFESNGEILHIHQHLAGGKIVVENKKEVLRDPHCIYYQGTRFIADNVSGNLPAMVDTFRRICPNGVSYQKKRHVYSIELILAGVTEVARLKFDRFNNNLSVLKIEARTKGAIIEVTDKLGLDANKLVGIGPKELLQHSHSGVSIW